MEVHKCDKFCNDHLQEHREAVKRICRYLLNTKAQGINLRPEKKRYNYMLSQTETYHGSTGHQTIRYQSIHGQYT